LIETEIQYPRSIMSLCLLSNAIAYYEPSGIKVGYMLPTTKKMHIMGLKKTFTSSPSFWYNSIWPYCSPNKTGNYQVFLNKAVDLLSMNNDLSLQAFNSWQQFLSEHSETYSVDPLVKCQEWLKREDFVKSLSECINIVINNVKFRVPYQVKVNKNYDIDNISIEFPVIIKANSASVTKMSHIMSLVFNKSGLKEAINLYEEDCIIQEFINHDMTVYKIYVIGNQIEYKPRQSCSNLSYSGKDCVTFNSAEPWPEDLKSGTRIIKDLNRLALSEATQRISSHLGLSIYGYDILVHSQTEDYIIVDVNVFPGFKEYSNLNPLLENLIRSLPNITNTP
jgi:inositol-1,3,4-trisphosphate 5/6-kinase / inositol-tetrakisphosphate 1-kinase